MQNWGYPLSYKTVDAIVVECWPQLPVGDSVQPSGAQAWLNDPNGVNVPIPSGNISYPTATQVAVQVGPFPYAASLVGFPNFDGTGDYVLNLLYVPKSNNALRLPVEVAFSVSYKDDVGFVPG